MAERVEFPAQLNGRRRFRVGGRSLSGGCFGPPRRDFSARCNPGFAVALVDPDRADAKLHEGRTLALTDEAFEVADGASDPIRKLSF
jgi:hypothetical protein